VPDPVSWLLIEPGWQVVGPGGDELGRVERVDGDQNADIFDGLEVSGVGYVAAERVGPIVEGRIQLTA
jgi:hypothetical protein